VLLALFEHGLNLGKISVDTFVNLKLKEELPHKPRRRSRLDLFLFSAISIRNTIIFQYFNQKYNYFPVFQVPPVRRHCGPF